MVHSGCVLTLCWEGFNNLLSNITIQWKNGRHAEVGGKLQTKAAAEPALRPRPKTGEPRHSVSLTSPKPNCPQTNLTSSPTTSHQAARLMVQKAGARRISASTWGTVACQARRIDGHSTLLCLARRPATSSERESLQDAFSTRFTEFIDL